MPLFQGHSFDMTTLLSSVESPEISFMYFSGISGCLEKKPIVTSENLPDSPSKLSSVRLRALFCASLQLRF